MYIKKTSQLIKYTQNIYRCLWNDWRVINIILVISPYFISSLLFIPWAYFALDFFRLGRFTYALLIRTAPHPAVANHFYLQTFFPRPMVFKLLANPKNIPLHFFCRVIAPLNRLKSATYNAHYYSRSGFCFAPPFAIYLLGTFNFSNITTACAQIM